MKKIKFINSIENHIKSNRKKYSRKQTIKLYALKYIPIYIFLFSYGFFKALIFSAIWWLFTTIFFDHRYISVFKPTIRIWFGVPGSGKTSVGAWLSRYSNRAGYKVLSNVNIKDTYKLVEDDLGNVDMSFGGDGCHVIYDEATVNGMDGRNFKDFAKTKKSLYFSLHRHMNNRVDVFSQGYDIDKRIRDRVGSNGLFYLKRFPIKGFVYYRRISKVLFIRKDDKQMIDGFEFKGLPRIVYTKSVWKSFDTLDMSLCPTATRKWELWT